MKLGNLLFAAIGLAIFIEGLPYFISPPATRRTLEHLARLGDGALRTIGFGLMVTGLLVAYVTLH